MADTVSPDDNNKIEFGEYEQRDPTLKILPTKSKITEILPYADSIGDKC